LEIYLKGTVARKLREKKENVCARNGGAGKRGAATVVGATWSEARNFDGSPTLVEEEKGLTWWWRDAGIVAEREGRLAGAAWPETRHNGGSTNMRTRVVVSPEVAEREGGDNDGGNTMVAAQRWHDKKGNSRGGVAKSCREKWRRQRARGRKGFAFLSPN